MLDSHFAVGSFKPQQKCHFKAVFHSRTLSLFGVTAPWELQRTKGSLTAWRAAACSPSPPAWLRWSLGHCFVSVRSASKIGLNGRVFATRKAVFCMFLKRLYRPATKQSPEHNPRRDWKNEIQKSSEAKDSEVVVKVGVKKWGGPYLLDSHFAVSSFKPQKKLHFKAVFHAAH